MKIKKSDKVLLVGKKKYLIEVGKGKFSTEYGEFDLSKLAGKNYGCSVKTHMGKEFSVIKPRQVDLLRKIKRIPQIITFKDAGLIASYTGLSKTDVVVEAGTGSGALTIYLAGITKKVYTYEIRKEFAEVAKKNLEKCGVKNVTVKVADITKGISQKNVDVVILDMGSPENAVENAKKALKPGGFLVVYSPVIEQVQRVYEKLDEFIDVETREAIVRKWDIGNNKTRPQTGRIGHTAFLTFARKV